ncbi:MAG: nucleoside hydrolase [Acetobacteraceae bacterium]|nr:nucleoside hydrolase [Acetobacteraceae bacterium]
MPLPVIIDCDPGTDDAFALLLAFASPELDVRAITVSGGNVPLNDTLRNALSLRALAGARVPVFAGADRPLLGTFTAESQVHGPDGLQGVPLPPAADPEPELAADAIRRILREAAEPVTVVGIAPVTNLALALATEPALRGKIAQIVLMSGAWTEGNITPSAEFNAFSDPEALQIVLDLGRPVVLATLELTAQALATPERLARLRAAGSSAALRILCDIQDCVPLSPRLAGFGAPLHDPCAVAWLIQPSLFATRACPACVDLGPGPSRGRTVIDRWNRLRQSSNVTVLETLNVDGFFALLGERLSGLP